MSGWGGGYQTELPYPAGFYTHVTPSVMALAALFQGYLVPGLRGEPIRILEHGAGRGLSASIVAALNPQIEYHAHDYNPGHIAAARLFAGEAGLDNVTFREADFLETANDASLGQFDIVVLHGVYSWVDEAARRQIIDLVARKLRPGGLLYVSYNALPGATWHALLQRILLTVSDEQPHLPPQGRLEEGFRVLDQLAALKARTFDANPDLAERAAKARGRDPRYLAHEYLNRGWTALYATEVASALAGAKLTYIGHADPIQAIEDLHHSPEQKAFLGARAGPPREALRDVLVNRSFRADLYMKGTLRLGPTTARERWLEQRFALAAPRTRIELQVKTTRGTVALPADLFGPILDGLADGPRSVAELLESGAIREARWPAALEALAIMTSTRFALPQPPSPPAAARARAARFNAAALNRSRSSSDIGFLASPVTMNGHALDRMGQLALLFADLDLESAAGKLWDALRAQGQYLERDGKPLAGDADNLAEATRRIEAFRAADEPHLRGLGIP